MVSPGRQCDNTPTHPADPFGANAKQNPICGKLGAQTRPTYSERSRRLNPYVVKAREPIQQKVREFCLAENIMYRCFGSAPVRRTTNTTATRRRTRP
eukprot:12431475-Karenia_brevis.AAC.1